MTGNTHTRIADYYETVQKAPDKKQNAANLIHNSRPLIRTTELP
jgi:hypothetical protein